MFKLKIYELKLFQLEGALHQVVLAGHIWFQIYDRLLADNALNKNVFHAFVLGQSVKDERDMLEYSFVHPYQNELQWAHVSFSIMGHLGPGQLGTSEGASSPGPGASLAEVKRGLQL